MGATELTQIITSVGFPIVACCVMGWYVKYITDQLITKVQESLDNNTKVLAELCANLEREEKRKDED